MVSWIPSSIAKVGNTVKLKEAGEWKEGWTVVSVYKREKGELVEARARDHLAQRGESDV